MLEISVILPIHNCANFLPAVLEGFRRQTLPQSLFEIVVVDDGSTDDGPRIVDCAQSSLPVRAFRQHHAGFSAAKNLGLFASRGTIVLFVDDDKIGSPDLLLTHLTTHMAHPEPQVAVLGQTRLAVKVEQIPVMRHVTHVGGELFSYDGMQPGFVDSITAFRGGTSCKRQFLINHGIFNPVFDFGCEDIEFGFRLREFGLKLLYAPGAICTMIQSFSFRELCKRQEQIGRSERKFAESYRTSEVRRHCQIDEKLSLWNEKVGHFSQYMKWVERIDKMAQLRAHAGRPLRSSDQALLDDAYRAAFALCRARGVGMAEATSTGVCPDISRSVRMDETLTKLD